MRRKTQEEKYLDAVMGLPFPNEWPHDQIAVTVLDVDPAEVGRDMHLHPERANEKVPTTDIIFEKRRGAWHCIRMQANRDSGAVE